MAEFWLATQRALQGEDPIIRRPRLTEALLNKPPFRFLHDIVTEVTKATGFAEGLFAEEELNSANIKDKEGKVQFLAKIINCVGIALGQNVPVRPLKVVAGLEPENTNVFLQMLALAATSSGPAGAAAVQRVLAGEQSNARRSSGGAPPAPPDTPMVQPASAPQKPADPPSGPPSAPTPSPPPMTVSPPAPASVPPPTALPVAPPQRPPSAKRGPVQPPEAPPPPTLPPSQPSTSPLEMAAAQAPTTAQPPTTARNARRRPKDDRSEGPGELEGSSVLSRNAAAEVEMNAPSTAQAAGSASSMRRESGGEPQGRGERDKGAPHDTEEELRPPASNPPPGLMARPGMRPMTGSRGPERPQSARRGPPKLSTNVVPADKRAVEGRTSTPGSAAPPAALERPSTSSRMRPAEVAPRPGVITDSIQNGDDNDDKDNPITILDTRATVAETTAPVSTEGAGKLVRDILEAKKELEGQIDGVALEEGSLKGGGQVEGIGRIILGKGRRTSASGRKDDVASKKEELHKLRDVVQALVQSTNPLGKSMDYLQEDLENMAKEYHFWSQERATYTAKLEEEMKLTEEALQGSAAALTEVEEEIRLKREAIDSVKAQTLRSDETIAELIRVVVVGAAK